METIENKKEPFSIPDINRDRLRSILARISREELLNLSEPCYVPLCEQYYKELVHVCGIDEHFLQDFAEVTWKGRPEKKEPQVSDHITLFIIWLMWYSLTQNEPEMFQSALLNYMIRQYEIQFKKRFKFCKPEVFNDALDRLSSRHLFKREETIPGAVSYLAKAIGQKYIEGIRRWDLDKISKFINRSREAVKQSLWSFAKKYYEINDNPKTEEPPPGQESTVPPFDEKDQRAFEVTNAICVKGEIDQEALKYAEKLTKIKMSTARLLLKELSSSTNSAQYSNDVRDILYLFLKNLPSAEPLTDYRFYLRHFRGLMRVKRTNKPVYFKKQVHELLRKLVKNTGYNNTFESLTKQTQSLHSEFLAFYITMVLKNHL